MQQNINGLLIVVRIEVIILFPIPFCIADIISNISFIVWKKCNKAIII